MINVKKNTYLMIFFMLFCNSLSVAQEDSTFSSIAAIVTFDSTITITAKRGLNVEDFIALSISDESLYKAFKRLRVNTYQFDSRFNMFNAQGEINEFYQSRVQQYYQDGHRRMEIHDESYSDRFFKRGRKSKPRYYTFDLFKNLFYTTGRVKESWNPELPINDQNEDGKLKGMAKQIHELKKLIFAPGSETHVALMGNKTEIFSKKMIPFYDYMISKQKIDGQEHYIFSVVLKDKWKKKPAKTVIKSFITYFDRETLEVRGRKYDLTYSTIAYSFDVKMNIRLHKIKGKYIPSEITYNGWWNIPLKKQEKCRFNVTFYNFLHPVI